MDKTQLSLNAHNMSSTSLAERQRIRNICVSNLKLTDEETQLLFEQDGPLLVSSDRSPEQLAKIIRDLKALGVWVQPQESDSDENTHMWLQRASGGLPENPTEMTSSPISQVSTWGNSAPLTNIHGASIPTSSRSTLRDSLLRLPRNRSMLWTTGLAVFTTLLVVYFAISRSFDHDSRASFVWHNHAEEQEEANKIDYAHLLPENQSIPPQTFEGVGIASGVRFSVKLLQAGELVLVRIVAVPEAPHDHIPTFRSSGIERAEAEPLFLTKNSERIHSGTTRAVLASKRVDQRFLGTSLFEVSVEMTEQKTPSKINVHFWQPPPEDNSLTADIPYLEGLESSERGDLINISLTIPLSTG